MTRKCVCCGGGEFIDGVELLDTGDYSKRLATLRLERDPEAIVFREPVYSGLDVAVCEMCGFVHYFASDLQELRLANEVRIQKSPDWRGMGKEDVYVCQNCDTRHDRLDCPKCGTGRAEQSDGETG